jgi:hypothetical protein
MASYVYHSILLTPVSSSYYSRARRKKSSSESRRPPAGSKSSAFSIAHGMHESIRKKKEEKGNPSILLLATVQYSTSHPTHPRHRWSFSTLAVSSPWFFVSCYRVRAVRFEFVADPPRPRDGFPPANRPWRSKKFPP